MGWSHIDEGTISAAVRRFLTEGGTIVEGQPLVVVITHWEEVGQFRISKVRLAGAPTRGIRSTMLTMLTKIICSRWTS